MMVLTRLRPMLARTLTKLRSLLAIALSSLRALLTMALTRVRAVLTMVLTRVSAVLTMVLYLVAGKELVTVFTGSAVPEISINTGMWFIYNSTNYCTILILLLHIITYDLLLHVSTLIRLLQGAFCVWLKLHRLLILIKCNC